MESLERLMRVKSESKLVEILDRVEALVPSPRRILAKVRHELEGNEPYIFINASEEDIYKTLTSLGYEVNVKDPTNPRLTLKSLEEGFIPEYDFGENIVAAKYIGKNRRLHVRMWKVSRYKGKPIFKVEAHTEIYPTTGELRYPKNLIEWLRKASLHIRDPHADYKEGLDLFRREVGAYFSA